MDGHRFETREIHSFRNSDPLGAVIPPIYTSVTFEYDSPTEIGSPYRYGRMKAPTRDALESMVASLEGAREARAFASGMAAIDAVFSLLEPGDHVVAGDSLYAETHDLLTDIYPTYGIDVSFVDTCDQNAIASAIDDETAMIYLETPSNPMLHVSDIEATATLATEAGAVLVVDNTFASPVVQRPLELGADIVIESLTKFVGGHSDVIAGAAATSDADLADHLDRIQEVRGAIPGPFDCYLALRGGRTLSSRVRPQCESAATIARFLDDHPAVTKTYYPGIESHPNHEVASDQMDSFGSMLSFELDGGRDVATDFLAALEVFTLAESLGAVESLIEVPAVMTHQDHSPAELEDAGIPLGLVRISVGTEHVDDLIDDLTRGLTAIER